MGVGAWVCVWRRRRPLPAPTAASYHHDHPHLPSPPNLPPILLALLQGTELMSHPKPRAHPSSLPRRGLISRRLSPRPPSQFSVVVSNALRNVPPSCWLGFGLGPRARREEGPDIAVFVRSGSGLCFGVVLQGWVVLRGCSSGLRQIRGMSAEKTMQGTFLLPRCGSHRANTFQWQQKSCEPPASSVGKR